ncbi:MAG TPA: hypothetical protein VF242_05800 [Nitrososphaeraceae archaeon]
MVKKFTLLLYAAAATTLIAGILHLNKVIDTISSGEAITNADILFLVGGIAQVFWIVPIIRQWGKTWYSIGIAGTAVFVLLWVITRIPENPITGRAGPISIEATIIQIFQIAFIILSIIILIKSTDIKDSRINTETK